MAKAIGGFVVAAVLGGGGAAGLNLFADKLVPPPAPRTSLPSIERGVVQLVDVQGEVKALMPDGEWRYVRVGFSLTRPTGLRVVGPNSRVTVRFSGVTLDASMDADVLIGAPGDEIGVQLEKGRIIVARSGKDLTTHIPRHDAVVRGPAYGIWAHEDRVSVAVLGERAEVEHLDERPIRFGRAREIQLTRTKAIPTVLEDQLEIKNVETRRRGRGYRLTARTARHAVVLARVGDDEYERVPLDISGNFSVDISDEQPSRGEVVVHDAAGRMAEVDRSSRSLADVLIGLTDAEPSMNRAVSPEEAEAIRTIGGDRPTTKRRAEEPPPRRAAPPPPPVERRAPPVERRAPPVERRAPPPPPPERSAPPPAKSPTREVTKQPPPPVRIEPPPPPKRSAVPSIGAKPEAPAPRDLLDEEILDDPEDEIDEDEL